MSLEYTISVAAFGLALALLSIRTLLRLAGPARVRYGVLLVAAVVFGLLAGRALHGLFAEPGARWVTWPLGPLGGLALVELGKPALRASVAVMRTAGKAIGRRFGGGE